MRWRSKHRRSDAIATAAVTQRLDQVERELEVAEAEDHAKASDTWKRTAESLRRVQLLRLEVELMSRQKG